MKVFYNPAFNGFIYQDFSQNKIAFNMTTCNTKGLTDLIELHAGLHIPVSSEIERILEYYAVMKSFNKKFPDNIFAKSFERDGINTAKECLKWRDAMLLAGWCPGQNDVSERQKLLGKLEQKFSSISNGEKLLRIIKAVENGCSLPENLEIILPFDYKCFSPVERKLLEVLENRIGKQNIYVYKDYPKNQNDLHKIADIILNNKPDKISLEKSDGSIEIVSFDEKNDALKYLSQTDASSYDVWINRDNRAFDNWLGYVHKPACGSVDRGESQISLLPLIGLGIFSKPLNLSSLLSWLSVPLSPLSCDFRQKLTEEIVGKGGYFNSACRKVLDSAGEDDKKIIQYFLPDIEKPEEAINPDSKIKIEDLQNYIDNLQNWINRTMNYSGRAEYELVQLSGALMTSNAVSKILSVVEEDEITYEDLMLEFDTLSSEIETEVSKAQKGCQNLICSSWNVASKAQTTIWCDFYNPEEQKLTYSFLLPSEKKALPCVWKEDDERAFIRNNKYLPFVFTEKKLTLVTVNKNGTQDSVKEPLIIRFEKNMGENSDGKNKLAEYLVHKDITSLKGVSTEEVKPFCNRYQNEDGTINFKRTDLVNFRKTESFTSISNLIENPFDYVFDKIINLKQEGASALAEVFTTKGTVAHAVIEELFNPSHGGKPSDIRTQIDTRFEEVINQKILENGGILLQTENLSETEIFKQQMKDCVNHLLAFIDKNGLTVAACEQVHQNIELPEFSGTDISFSGSIDMVLEDSQKNPVIFDFKYSPKQDKYQDWIRNNRAMQLSLYKGLVAKANHKNVKAAAYVLLPDIKVITADDLAGFIYRTDVNEERMGNLLVEMRNSYEFRKNQILNGIVEDGEGIESDSLDYVDETEVEELVPLDIEVHSRLRTAEKKPNPYSSYGIFKAGN